jgi:hypothetical protein
VNVYIVLDDNPVTVEDVPVPVPIIPPGLLVIVKPVIVPFPPLGAVKVTITEDKSKTVAVPIVGAPDMVVTALDIPDALDIPPEFVAVTVNVYIVFAVNPDTIIGEDVPVPIKPPGLLVTV